MCGMLVGCESLLPVPRYVVVPGAGFEEGGAEVPHATVEKSEVDGQMPTGAHTSTCEESAASEGGLLVEPVKVDVTATTEPEDLSVDGFAGPLSWKGWTRTHIFGKYKPLSSVFKGKRHTSTGRAYYHQGLDVLAPRGTAIIAPADGMVVQAGEWDKRGYGKAVLIRVSDGSRELWVLYAHLDRVLVSKGERLTRGEPIGKAGTSGNAGALPRSEEHVHIEVRMREKVARGVDGRVDPLTYFTNVVPPRELRSE